MTHEIALLSEPVTAEIVGRIGMFEPVAIPADRHPAAVYLASLPSPHSRRAMRSSLSTVAAMFGQTVESMPWHALRYQHTSAIAAQLAQSTGSPATGNRHLAALRGTLKAAWMLELMAGDDYHRARSFKLAPGSRLAAGREVSGGELRALCATCVQTDAAGARNAAVLALLYAGGLRRAEVVSLDLASLDTETGELRFVGKRNKQRKVFATNGNGALPALRTWLGHRGSEPGPLLCPVRRNGKIELRRLSAQAIANLCRTLADEAGVRAFSPHDMRRTMIGDSLDAGVDLATLSDIVGHESPATTKRYDRRGDRAKRAAADMLHMPAFGPAPVKAAPRKRAAKATVAA